MIFTKSTRLKMSPDLLEDIKSWTEEKRLEELKYISNSIPSSWEFIGFTFFIEGVSRGFTRQLVRTRNASFAQQSMRVTNVENSEYLTGPSIEKDETLKDYYEESMNDIRDSYQHLLEMGAAIEDARGVLPTNILTNIVMKIDMKNLTDMIKKRVGRRVQDEYRRVVDAMMIEAMRIYPWFHLFAKRDLIEISKNLEGMIVGNPDIPKEDQTKMFKMIDQLRSAL